MSNVPRKPRPRKEQKPGDSGTALAMLFLLVVTGGLIGLGTLVLGKVFLALVLVVLGFIGFIAFHYLLWGWWLKGNPPEEEEKDKF